MINNKELTDFLGVPIASFELSSHDVNSLNCVRAASTKVSFENAMEQVFKVKTKAANPPAPIKQCRTKAHEQDLKLRYLSPKYVYKLLNVTHILEYDNGARPVCPRNCPFQCQAKFCYDAKLLGTEMEQWWGGKSNNVHRDTLLYADLKDWAVKKADGSFELRWFIANRQVCRNFYLRARGQHHTHVSKMETQVLYEKRTLVSVSIDRYEMEQPRKSPEI